MIVHLRALVFAVWSALHPSLPSRPDAPLIAEGIALAVATDSFQAIPIAWRIHGGSVSF